MLLHEVDTTLNIYNVTFYNHASPCLSISEPGANGSGFDDAGMLLEKKYFVFDDVE